MPSTAKTLSFTKAKRIGLRFTTDEVIKKLQSTLDEGDPQLLDKVRSHIRSVKQCYALVAEADQTIGMLLDDDDELEAEVTETGQYQLKVTTILSEAEVFVEDNTLSSTDGAAKSATANVQGRELTTVKLPELRLATFDGDPLKWQEFWDAYETTIHNNADLQPIDKFKYLKEFLDGNVLLLAEGYRMTSANYNAVIDQLKQRYGNKELTIQAHFDALLSLRPATGNINDLQLYVNAYVYDECEVHIRSLVALDMDEATFGGVFAPILKSKVPEEIRLELERRHHGGPWLLSDLRQLLRSEIHARRMSKLTLGRNNSSWNGDDQSEPGGNYEEHVSSASALVANAQSGNKATRPCAFCRGIGHFHDECSKYPDLEGRIAVLGNVCCLCLGKNHQMTACYWRESNYCVYCKGRGKHNRSLCPQKFGKVESVDVSAAENPQHAQSMVSPIAEPGHGLAVMQTALATVKGSSKSEKVRLLFDAASTRSFARSDLLNRIGAKSLGNESLAVAGCGKRITDNYRRAEVHLTTEDGTAIPLQVSGLPSISSKIQKQAIDLNKYPILDNLKFADPIPEKPELVQVDILIGLDHYYSLVETEQCRINNLAVIGTKVGLVASGFVQQDDVVGTSQGYDTHTVMMVTAQQDTTMDTSWTANSATYITSAQCRLWLAWVIAFALCMAAASSLACTNTREASLIARHNIKPFPKGPGTTIRKEQQHQGMKVMGIGIIQPPAPPPEAGLLCLDGSRMDTQDTPRNQWRIPEQGTPWTGWNGKGQPHGMPDGEGVQPPRTKRMEDISGPRNVGNSRVCEVQTHVISATFPYQCIFCLCKHAIRINHSSLSTTSEHSRSFVKRDAHNAFSSNRTQL